MIKDHLNQVPEAMTVRVPLESQLEVLAESGYVNAINDLGLENKPLDAVSYRAALLALYQDLEPPTQGDLPLIVERLPPTTVMEMHGILNLMGTGTRLTSEVTPILPSVVYVEFPFVESMRIRWKQTLFGRMLHRGNGNNHSRMGLSVDLDLFKSDAGVEELQAYVDGSNLEDSQNGRLPATLEVLASLSAQYSRLFENGLGPCVAEGTISVKNPHYSPGITNQDYNGVPNLAVKLFDTRLGGFSSIMMRIPNKITQ